MVPTTAFCRVAFFTITRRPILRTHLAQRSLVTYSSAALSNTHPSPVVSVFDNVLSPTCRTELTSDALYDTGPDVYRRDQGTYSPQDVLIESILVGLAFDKTKEVEWWGRSIYESVEAHRDVDEEAASARGIRRYPTHSLVVYLNVEEGICGPTCLWVPTDDDNGGDERRSALVAVPVVPGRLLVFSGELLHAVPCPPLQWLDHIKSTSTSHTDPTMRRVLVLNLWDDYAPKDEADEGYDDDDDFDDNWDDDDKEHAEPQAPTEFFAKRVECEPRSNWQPITLQGPLEDDAATPATLSARSHGSDEHFVSHTSSRTAISQMLESKSIPQWLWTTADATDLGIGVPSVAGSREERMR